MRCDSALHMSYTVSAATVAPVSASISTPVRCVVRTVQSIRNSRSPAQSMAMLHPSIGSGWQKGIRSHVRLTAMVPATIAVSTIAPFLLRSLLARNCAATSAGKRTRHSALAARAVAGLAETSTIAGWPAASMCVNEVLRVATQPPTRYISTCRFGAFAAPRNSL